MHYSPDARRRNFKTFPLLAPRGSGTENPRVGGSIPSLGIESLKIPVLTDRLAVAG
jgi:hypothetical protein